MASEDDHGRSPGGPHAGEEEALADRSPTEEREILAAPAQRGPWFLVYEGFDPAQEGLREALCTTANGYFATRGAAPESRADGTHYPGTYVAGIFNRLTSEVQGRSIENEDMVNLPNWLPLGFRIEDGPWFDPAEVELLSYEQELDLRRAVLTRRIRFRDEQGRHTRLAQRRFTSMASPHVAAIETTIEAEDWSGSIEIRSGIDGDVENAGIERYRDLEGRHLEPALTEALDDEALLLETRTNQSQIEIAEAVRTRLRRQRGPVESERRLERPENSISQRISCELARGEGLTIEKVATVYTARDPAIPAPGVAARQQITEVAGFDDLLADHTIRWDHLWRRGRLELDEGPRTTFVLNLHLFHLLQTVSENSVDLDVGVPARGLHGEAYRGHIFWDELFVFPYLSFRMPELTKSLLRYRHRRLPAARRCARESGCQGAMFPWQSGSDGSEESQSWHLNPRSGRWLPDNSHLQRHINIAVAYNAIQHYRVTNDREFLAFQGAELVLEIARFWAGVAAYDHVRDRYEIRGVMGPDEYHDAYPGAERPGLDNNAYTNVMVVWTLSRALELLDELPLRRANALRERMRLSPEELGRWHDVSERIFVPFHEGGIISQFEGYEDLEEFDWDGYRRRYGDIHRLDRILEAEGDTPNRYKASKQADVLMLFYLLSADELTGLFDRLGYELGGDAIARNIDYYTRRTSHGSTLSGVVHSWVLARSDRRRSWQLFREALESDVADVQGGTTPEGIHLGAMAGTIDLIQRGYTGMEARGDCLYFDPALPDELHGIEYSIHYRDNWYVEVAIRDGRLRVSLPPADAAPITIDFRGALTTVSPGESFEAAV